MADHDPEPAPRPEIVQAIYDALMSMDAVALQTLEQSVMPISPTERRRAEELFAASMLAGEDRLDRRTEVWHVLIARHWDTAPSWEQLFDDLTPERAARLGELYEALPDGGRAEFDRRYPTPEVAGGQNEETLAGMSPQESGLWRNARNLADLGELTAWFLEGRLSQTPTHMGPPCPETTGLIPLLSAVNRAGFVTCRSHPGEPADEDGWEQRAIVSGFAGDQAFARLMTAAAGADLIVTAARAGEDDWGPVLAITRDHGEEDTWIGGAESRRALRDGYRRACHPDAVQALASAWQVTLTDPEWGRDDYLWPVLESFAAPA